MVSIINDLVDEMQWEDIMESEGLFITLEDAGLENKPEYDTVPGSLSQYFTDEA